jgi:hypothetical protein
MVVAKGGYVIGRSSLSGVMDDGDEHLRDLRHELIAEAVATARATLAA